VTLPLIAHNLKIRCRKWPKDYYIYIYEEKLMDSSDNIFYYSWKEFIQLNQEVLDNAGQVWEIYES
jgi:hypothetical protein